MINSPLTDEQKSLPSGALVPSGEAGFFDFRQDYKYNFEGLTYPFPNPSLASPSVSGLIDVNNTRVTAVDKSGILHRNNENSIFSNYTSALSSGIQLESLYNNYIHYYPGVAAGLNGTKPPVTIPYLSTFTVAQRYNPYG